MNIENIRQSHFFKSMRKEWLVRGLLRSVLSPLMLTLITGLIFWPLSIIFFISAVIVAVREVLNIHFSLLALAEMNEKDFAELVKQSNEGKLESAIIGSYAKDGLLLRSAYIPYNSIVKMKYYTPKLLSEFFKDVISFIFLGSPWRSKNPRVIIHLKAELFGKEFILRFERSLPRGINCAPMLEQFTDKITAKSANKVLIDNDYVFYGKF